MTHTNIEDCTAVPPQRNLGRRLEMVARTSAVTLLFLCIVALPIGLTYVELAFAS
jgi:hypothetical protein